MEAQEQESKELKVVGKVGKQLFHNLFRQNVKKTFGFQTFPTDLA